jgi:tetratricopeptide (TPR) repeat protein
MYCHNCGFFNPDEAPICINCGTKLVANASPKFGNLDEFDQDNIFAQVLSKFENNFSDIFEDLTSLQEKTKELEHEIVLLKSGLSSLVELLSEKDVIKHDKFSHVWENSIINDIKNKEEKERFLDQKESIVLMHKGKHKNAFRKTMLKAEEFIVNGDLDSGMEILADALKKDSSNYRLAFYLGQSLYMRGELKKAKKYFLQAYKNNKDDYDTNLYLGLICNDQGQTEDAIEYLNNAIEISPDYYLPYFTLGTIFFFEENYPLAEFFLSLALEKEKMPEILFFLALLKRDMGQKRKAEKLFLETIEVEPEFEDAYYYLGMLYLSLGWTKKAENMLSKMQNLNPSKLDFPTLESLDKIDPEWVEKNETVHKILRRCESFARKKEYDLAVNHCRNLVKNDPDNPLILARFAIYLAESDRLEEASVIADKIISLDSTEEIAITAYNIKHNYLRTTGNFLEAKALMIQLATKIKSDFAKAQAYSNQAFDCIDLGELQEAEECAKAGLKKAPRELRHYALDALAWVNYKKNNLNKAYELLKESLSVKPANPVAVYHLGIVLLALRKTKDAEKMFKRLFDLREEGSPFPTHLIKSIKEHLGSLRQNEDIEGKNGKTS